MPHLNSLSLLSIYSKFSKISHCVIFSCIGNSDHNVLPLHNITKGDPEVKPPIYFYGNKNRGRLIIMSWIEQVVGYKTPTFHIVAPMPHTDESRCTLCRSDIWYHNNVLDRASCRLQDTNFPHSRTNVSYTGESCCTLCRSDIWYTSSI
jgi:hypothetical protein